MGLILLIKGHFGDDFANRARKIKNGSFNKIQPLALHIDRI